MPAPIRDLSKELRDARFAKGWTQRELSERSGLPQAHISRLEAGAVDPKLSTLRELSRLLDLEVMLVPRQALTAVGIVLRDLKTEAAGRPLRVLANKLARLATRLEQIAPHDDLAERIGERADNLSRDLAVFEPAIVNAPDVLAEMQRVAPDIEWDGSASDLERLSGAVRRLANLRNEFVHRRPDAERPAYSLEDDED
jgi:transcriptional regulator with XRE-family HTH domain